WGGCGGAGVGNAVIREAELVDGAAERAVQLRDGRVRLVRNPIEVVRHQVQRRGRTADVIQGVEVVVPNGQLVVRPEVEVAADKKLVAVQRTNELFFPAARRVVVAGAQNAQE